MKVMILAAGKGHRMLPLSRSIPKPLLSVNGQSLIERHIERLAEAGFSEMLINLYHLGEKIEHLVGDGSRWGVEIHYSREDGPLETGGGITNALGFLSAGKQQSEAAFAIVNGDIWTDYNFSHLPDHLDPGLMGHLVMVDNPEHHSQGDFVINRQGRLIHKGQKQVETLTYSGISILSPDLFANCVAEPFPLLKLLAPAVTANRFTAEYFEGYWADVGTIERYEKLLKDQA